MVKIIALEGIDRSGKSTIFKKLKEDEDLKGKLEFLKFPDKNTTYGAMVYESLLGDNLAKYKEIYTLYNSMDKNSVLEHYDKEDKLVIIDRFDASQYVYGKALGVCSPLNGLKYYADEIIYLDLPVRESLKRGGELGDNDLIEGDSVILNLVKGYYEDYFKHKHVFKLDAMLDEDSLYELVKEIIKTHF